jgi:adenylate kinase
MLQICKEQKYNVMINLILFGPPGSGKGTQAAKLVERYNLLHISTGDLFRYELSNNTPLGVLARSYMDKGELVPDEVTTGMLRNKVEAHPEVDGYIFDGFPRTTPQAEALDALLAERGQSISKLIMLDVPEEEVVNRLLQRGKDSGRADDTNAEIIRNRFMVYQKETAQVFDFYAEQGKSTKVHGVGSIEDIFDSLCAEIDQVNA